MYLIWQRDSTAKVAEKNTPYVIRLQYLQSSMTMSNFTVNQVYVYKHFEMIPENIYKKHIKLQIMHDLEVKKKNAQKYQQQLFIAQTKCNETSFFITFQKVNKWPYQSTCANQHVCIITTHHHGKLDSVIFKYPCCSPCFMQMLQEKY